MEEDTCGYSLLTLAARHRNPDLLLLLKEKLPVAKVEALTAKADMNGLTCLHHVLRSETSLVERGVISEEDGARRLSPDDSSVDCIRLLLDMRADAGRGDLVSATPLHWAAQFQSEAAERCSEILAEGMADPGARDLFGRTAHEVRAMRRCAREELYKVNTYVFY